MGDQATSAAAFADRLTALRERVGIGVSDEAASAALRELIDDIDTESRRPDADRDELGWWAASAAGALALSLVQRGDAVHAAAAYRDAARRWTEVGDIDKADDSSAAAAEQAVVAGGALDDAITELVAGLERQVGLDRAVALVRIAQLASSVSDRFEAGRRIDEAAALLVALGYPDPSDDPQSALSVWQSQAAAEQPGEEADPLYVFGTVSSVLTTWGTLLSVRGAIGRGYAAALETLPELGVQLAGEYADPRTGEVIRRGARLRELRDQYDTGADVPDPDTWTQMHEDTLAIITEARAAGGDAQVVAMAQTFQADLLTWASRPTEAAAVLAAARAELATASVPEANRSGLEVELIRRQVDVAAGLQDSVAVSGFAGEGIAEIEADRARLRLPYLEDSYLRTRRQIYIAGIAAARRLEDLELMLARADLVKARGALAWLPVPPSDVSAVRASLDADEAVIYHLWADRTVLYVLTVSRDEIVCDRRLLSEEERADLDSLLTDFQDPANRPPVWADREVPRLAALFLPSEGASILADKKRVYVSPNGLGHQVPMHALDWRGRPLIESFAVSYVPSFAALTRRAARPATGAAIVLGLGGFADAPPLPHAETEAVDVSRCHPGADLLVGPAASSSAVADRVDDGRLSAAPVLHLATHGDDGPLTDPLAARFLLADGEVTGTSMAEWRLGADLVVLSACWSAQRAVLGRDGSELFGDEVYGLQSAFFRAGARQVLGAMWPASDRVTAPLMHRVHELLNGGVAADAALRAATLEARERDGLLYHWATYKLTTMGRPPMTETQTETP